MMIETPENRLARLMRKAARRQRYERRMRRIDPCWGCSRSPGYLTFLPPYDETGPVAQLLTRVL